MKVKSRIIFVSGRQVHLRTAGSGPPVILLHPSPNWSKSLDLYIKTFSKKNTAIAIDTPGYGHSELLNINKPKIKDFADALNELLETLSINKCSIWGSHTGATIALEFAIRYPEKVSVFIADGYPAYTRETRIKMLKNHLPPYKPKWDGSHLLHTWHKFREMFIFSPTYEWHKKNRTKSSPPKADLIQKMITPRLITGRHYTHAYRAVFKYDSLNAIGKLKVPSCFGARSDDSLIKCFKLIEPRLKKNAWLEEFSSNKIKAAESYNKIIKKYSQSNHTITIPKNNYRRNKVNLNFLDLETNQIAYKSIGSPKDIPTIILPPIPGDSYPVVKIMKYLNKFGHYVLSFDLPGNGDTEGFIKNNSINSYAKVLNQIIKRFSFNRINLIGFNGGASVATEFNILRRNFIKNLILFSPIEVPISEENENLKKFATTIIPKWDGTHLINLWFSLRNEQLFYPWYKETNKSILNIEPKINPENLSKKMTGIMKNYEYYDKVWKNIIKYKISKKLKNVPSKTIIINPDNNPYKKLVINITKSLPNLKYVEIKDNDLEIAKFIHNFFYN